MKKKSFSKMSAVPLKRFMPAEPCRAFLGCSGSTIFISPIILYVSSASHIDCRNHSPQIDGLMLFAYGSGTYFFVSHETSSKTTVKITDNLTNLFIFAPQIKFYCSFCSAKIYILYIDFFWKFLSAFEKIILISAHSVKNFCQNWI